MNLDKEQSVINYPLAESITSGSNLYEKKMIIKNRLEIHYLNKRKEKDVYKDVSHAVSWLETKNGYVLFDGEGIPVNARDLVFSGDMGEHVFLKCCHSIINPGKLFLLSLVLK